MQQETISLGILLKQEAHALQRARVPREYTTIAALVCLSFRIRAAGCADLITRFVWRSEMFFRGTDVSSSYSSAEKSPRAKTTPIAYTHIYIWMCIRNSGKDTIAQYERRQQYPASKGNTFTRNENGEWPSKQIPGAILFRRFRKLRDICVNGRTGMPVLSSTHIDIAGLHCRVRCARCVTRATIQLPRPSYLRSRARSARADSPERMPGYFRNVKINNRTRTNYLWRVIAPTMVHDVLWETACKTLINNESCIMQKYQMTRVTIRFIV